MSDIDNKLKEITEIEQILHKKIDDDVKQEEEIDEIAKYTAQQLSLNPMVPFSINGRDFLVVAAMYNNSAGERCIQLVAREKNTILTPNAKVIKANMVLDTNYTKEENLIVGIKALLGHITGCIKPEVLE